MKSDNYLEKQRLQFGGVCTVSNLLAGIITLCSGLF